MNVAGLAALRSELAAACGGPGAAAAWLASFLADLASGDVAMGLSIAEADQVTLRDALAADGTVDALALDITRAGEVLQITASAS